MTTPADSFVRFVPSRVDGVSRVTEVVVFPDRLELLSAGPPVVVRFADIARWDRPARVRRILAWAGWKTGFRPVADRDWFHPPPGRFFRFYTDPPVTIFMADEPATVEYGRTLFRRIQDVIGAGGFGTRDLG